MSKNSENSFFAFLFGIFAGGILGLLFAPEKGSQTRDRLSFLLDKYKKRVEELMAELVDGKEEGDNKAKSEGEKIIDNTKQKAEELLDDVNGLIDQIKKSD